MNQIKKLNLGCGENYKDGWINLDINKNVKVDVYADIEKGLPFENNYFDEVFCKHILEHIHPDRFSEVMDELFRVCKGSAIIQIWCPHFSCGITYKTISHLTPISYFTFIEDNKFHIEKKRLSFFRESFSYKMVNPLVKRFMKLINPILSFLPNLIPLLYERCFCWIYPCEEVYFKLEVRKE